VKNPSCKLKGNSAKLKYLHLNKKHISLVTEKLFRKGIARITEIPTFASLQTRKKHLKKDNKQGKTLEMEWSW